MKRGNLIIGLIISLALLALIGLYSLQRTGKVHIFKIHSGSSLNAAKIANHDLEKFEFDQFKNPDSFYWPAYFWLWNNVISKDIVSKQLEDMNSHGARSVCIHPMPKAFRPATMFTLMEPDYLTPAYFDVYRFAIQQCQKLNMRSYLYDEGGWPSGACLGQVVEQNPSLIYKQLARQILTPQKGTPFSIPDSCLSAFLYQGETKIKQLAPGSTGTIDVDSARIMLFNVMKGGTWWPYQYPDLLNPESTKEFLRLTHEKYKDAVGPFFGKTIHITFTDEAQVANPGWTDDLADDFKARYGYDIRDELPSIFEGEDENDKKVRIDYFDWWSQRNADAYYGQIQQWCQENNLLSSGHLNGEDKTIFARRYGYGHPLRALRKMDVPGVDVIWRQLWPGEDNHHFPKFASSVAHQSDLPWSLSESFAVYGSGLTPAQMKWITDYQSVRGINLFVFSNYPVSKKNWLLGALRPMFGPENPFWNYVDNYHGYVARLGYLMSLGKADVKTAVYYPVRDIWAGGPDVDAICVANDELVKALLENQCDFDFIDDDILESGDTKIRNGNLMIGSMCYNTICLSRNRFMPDKSIKRLEKFISGGGRVFLIDESNSGIKKPKGVITVTLSELTSLLTPTVALGFPNVNIRVCKRTLNDCSIYFVTNEDSLATSCKLQFQESANLIQLNPETGECWTPLNAVRTSTGWELPLHLNFAGSAVILFSNQSYPLSAAPDFSDEVVQTISEGWKLRKAREFVVTGDDLEVRELTSENRVDISLGDWREVVGDIFSGDVEYEVIFKCPVSVKNSAGILDLGDVRYACQVSLNGEQLGKKLWKPYEYNIKGKIKEGDNILKVIVTNSLANQYVYTNKLDKWPVKKLGPYHSRQLGFEKESVASGLFGPVTIKKTR
ncbi:MAG: glycosyl hydrolase [Fermentimonas sp.]|jgi:hypothetical protein